MLDEDRLMLDRSPDEMGSHGNDDDMISDDSDHGDGDNTGGETTDGERIIYPWMKKIHVAGVGMFRVFFIIYSIYKIYSLSNLILL